MSKDRRVKLESGKQREIILELSKKYGSLKNLSTELKIHYSTLKGYSLEALLIPESLFNKILNLLSVKKDDLKVSYLPSNWGNIIGGKKGIESLQKKYPKKIIEWRRNALKKYKISNPEKFTKKIKKPKLDEKLSEFIGVYLGDGTITPYFIRITGDYRYDLPYFNYLSNLILKLFGVRAVIKKERKYNTTNLIIYSKNLCHFLNKEFGIKFGHKIKNKTIIPQKILNDKVLTLACLRGLIDTDGSISRRGRKGSQFCIQFTSHNKKLLEQVSKIGEDLQIFTFKDKTGTGTNKWENIIKYFNTIGSSNLRHIVRFHERRNNNTIYQRDVIKYYNKKTYKEIKLPYKIGPVV